MSERRILFGEKSSFEPTEWNSNHQNWKSSFEKLVTKGSSATKWNTERSKQKPVLIFRKKIIGSKESPKGFVAKGVYDNQAVDYIFFPKKEHFDIFYSANSHVQGGGPSEIYPGSVGSIEVQHGKEWVINHIQSHFKTLNGTNLTRSISTKYRGWRFHVLRTIFEEAKVVGVPIRFPIIKESEKLSLKMINEDIKAIKKIAKENDYFLEVKETNQNGDRKRYMLVAKPFQK